MIACSCRVGCSQISRHVGQRGCIRLYDRCAADGVLETRDVLKVFGEKMIGDAVEYTEHARCKTVTATDVVHALKRQGLTMYGFGC